MKDYGLIRVAAATMSAKVARPGWNSRWPIRSLIDEACEKQVSLLVFPELCLSGYSCSDLFGQTLLLKKCEEEVASLAGYSYEKNMAIVVGAPVPFNGRLYNCAIVIKDGEVKGIVPKTYLASHGEYSQARWFASGSDLIHCPEIIYAGFECIISPNQIFEIGGATFAVEIGEDADSPLPPSSYHALAGAQIIADLSSGNEVANSYTGRDRALSEQSARTLSACIYSSASGDSSQDCVFTGHASVWENGVQIASVHDTAIPSLAIADVDIEKLDNLRRKSTTFTSVSPDGTPSASYSPLYCQTYLGERHNTDFTTFYGKAEKHPFAPESELDGICRKILQLQTTGLSQRLNRIQAKAVIGISGGLDSTLALLVTALAFDSLEKYGGNCQWKHENIIAVTMPGFGTTPRTKNNAWDLMKALGVTCREISIVPACEQHFSDIGHDVSIHDATYENTQARERTQILMDIANQVGGIVVGTGDLSELALGWATYNGDHMSMYGVNAGVPKTLVRHLVKWAAQNCFQGMTAEDGRSIGEILLDIVDTPISPELLPASESGEIQQVTEDLVGPYELHDFFLYHFMHYGFSPEKIFFLAQKAFASDYDDQTIKKWLKTFIRRFFSQQFKRSCMPDGPKVLPVSLSPRGGWHMVSDAWSEDFLSEL